MVTELGWDYATDELNGLFGAAWDRWNRWTGTEPWPDCHLNLNIIRGVAARHGLEVWLDEVPCTAGFESWSAGTACEMSGVIGNPIGRHVWFSTHFRLGFGSYGIEPGVRAFVVDHQEQVPDTTEVHAPLEYLKDALETLISEAGISCGMCSIDGRI